MYPPKAKRQVPPKVKRATESRQKELDLARREYAVSMRGVRPEGLDTDIMPDRRREALQRQYREKQRRTLTPEKAAIQSRLAGRPELDAEYYESRMSPVQQVPRVEAREAFRQVRGTPTGYETARREDRQSRLERRATQRLADTKSEGLLNFQREIESGATRRAEIGAATTRYVADAEGNITKYVTDANGQTTRFVATTDLEKAQYVADARVKGLEIQTASNERITDRTMSGQERIAEGGYRSAETIAAGGNQTALELANIGRLGNREIAEITGLNEREIAMIQGKTAEQIAQMQHFTATEVADLTGLSQERVEQIRGNTARDVTGLQGDTAEEIARIQRETEINRGRTEDSRSIYGNRELPPSVRERAYQEMTGEELPPQAREEMRMEAARRSVDNVSLATGLDRYLLADDTGETLVQTIASDRRNPKKQTVEAMSDFVMSVKDAIRMAQDDPQALSALKSKISGVVATTDLMRYTDSGTAERLSGATNPYSYFLGGRERISQMNQYAKELMRLLQ